MISAECFVVLSAIYITNVKGNFKWCAIFNSKRTLISLSENQNFYNKKQRIINIRSYQVQSSIKYAAVFLLKNINYRNKKSFDNIINGIN